MLSLDTFMDMKTYILAPTENRSKCVQCGTVVRENTTGIRACTDGIRCSDCYFRTLGATIEAHPPGHRRARRG